MKHTPGLLDGFRKYFLDKRLEPSTGVFFEEQPTQRFVSASSELLVAVSPTNVDPVALSPVQHSFSNWDVGKRRREAAWQGDWKVSLYLPRPEAPAKARTFPVAYAWDTDLVENYPTKEQANARALQLTIWWCNKNAVPFNPASSPYPIEARLNVTGILIGWIVCVFFFMSLLQAFGVNLSSTSTSGNVIFMIASLVFGGTIAELARHHIQKRKLKRIRTTCLEHYNQICPTDLSP